MAGGLSCSLNQAKDNRFNKKCMNSVHRDSEWSEESSRKDDVFNVPHVRVVGYFLNRALALKQSNTQADAVGYVPQEKLTPIP